MKVIYRVGFIVFSALLLSSAHAAAVSEEAKRYFDRGIAAVEMAKTPEDYIKAIQEFEKAARLAPQWPDVYFNLGMVQEKAERYRDAIESLKQYLRLAPNAADAETVKSHINKLEYKKEQSEEEAAILGNLIGKWVGNKGPNAPVWRVEFMKIGDKLYLHGPMTGVVAKKNYSTDYRKVPVTRNGRELSFSVDFSTSVPGASRLTTRATFNVNLELTGSSILKGKFTHAETKYSDTAYFIKDNDGSLWRMDDFDLARRLN